MATVSLKELSDNLAAARQLIDQAMDDDPADVPELQFAAVRKPLQAALDLLATSGTAADSARRKWDPDLAVAAVFPANVHASRNRA